MKHYLVTIKFTDEFNHIELAQRLERKGYCQSIDGIQLPSGTLYVEKKTSETELSIKREIEAEIEQLPTLPDNTDVVIAKIDKYLMPYRYYVR